MELGFIYDWEEAHTGFPKDTLFFFTNFDHVRAQVSFSSRKSLFLDSCTFVFDRFGFIKFTPEFPG